MTSSSPMLAYTLFVLGQLVQIKGHLLKPMLSNNSSHSFLLGNLKHLGNLSTCKQTSQSCDFIDSTGLPGRHVIILSSLWRSYPHHTIQFCVVFNNLLQKPNNFASCKHILESCFILSSSTFSKVVVCGF